MKFGGSTHTRVLDKVTVPDKFLVPIIDTNVIIFSKLDLKSRYYQVRVRPEDAPKVAYHEGHYEFLVMLFGLTHAHEGLKSL